MNTLQTTPQSAEQARSWFVAQQLRMECELAEVRNVNDHPTAIGDGSELHWLNMLGKHLPARYQASKAFVIDADGQRSEQIDIVIHDRQFSPCLLDNAGARYIPAESVYAVLEVKQALSKMHLEYAGAKIASVRRLRRTSAQYTQNTGVSRTEPKRILGGILTYESGWSPAFGDAFRSALATADALGRIDIGCALRNGGFDVAYQEGSAPTVERSVADSSLIFFFLRLLHRLQSVGTVPGIQYDQYTRTLVTLPDPEE